MPLTALNCVLFASFADHSDICLRLVIAASLFYSWRKKFGALKLRQAKRLSITPNSIGIYGARERTRTSTPLREPAPEAGASANSATRAQARQSEAF